MKYGIKTNRIHGSKSMVPTNLCDATFFHVKFQHEVSAPNIHLLGLLMIEEDAVILVDWVFSLFDCTWGREGVIIIF